eukprot:7033040-Prymnesium_polylepis.1
MCSRSRDAERSATRSAVRLALSAIEAACCSGVRAGRPRFGLRCLATLRSPSARFGVAVARCWARPSPGRLAQRQLDCPPRAAWPAPDHALP